MPSNHAKLRLAKTGPKQAELILYGIIDRWGDIDPRAVRDELKELGDVAELHVRINSEGGSIFDGLAVYNTLKGHSAKIVVHVDGMALSMASVIAMAGDEIVMAEGAMLMIHNPLWLAAGEAEDMRQAADVMDKLKDQLVGIYAGRTGQPTADIASLMDAETWFTAEEAIALGFADRQEDRMAIAATFDPHKFRNLPEHLRQASPTPTPPEQEPPMAENAKTTQPDNQGPKPASYHELKAAFPKADAEFLAGQQEADATLDQARAAWQKHLEDRAQAAEAKTQELEAKAQEAADKAAEALKNQAPGTEGLAEGQPPKADAGDFLAMVATEEARGIPRHRAVRNVAAKHPEARKAYVEAYNAEYPITGQRRR